MDNSVKSYLSRKFRATLSCCGIRTKDEVKDLIEKTDEIEGIAINNNDILEDEIHEILSPILRFEFPKHEEE